jgi:hypothetical protein
MTIMRRRSVLRASLGAVAAGTLVPPYLANAAATTATVWWVQGVQGFAQEDVAWYPRARNDYVNLYCVRRRQPPGDTGSERPMNRSLDRSPGHV